MQHSQPIANLHLTLLSPTSKWECLTAMHLIKTIRETDKEYRGNTPVIAVTGFASLDDERRAMAASFNAYIPKPFYPEDVVAAITKLLGASDDKVA
jgi:CheY-like chemotaxis protein